MTKGYFGKDWDVPATETLDRLATPVGEKCLDCGEEIALGERGYIMPCVLDRDELGRWITEYRPIHRECQFLGTSGHTFGWCSCTNYHGLSRRQAALQLWDEMEAMRENQEKMRAAGQAGDN